MACKKSKAPKSFKAVIDIATSTKKKGSKIITTRVTRITQRLKKTRSKKRR